MKKILLLTIMLITLFAACTKEMDNLTSLDSNENIDPRATTEGLRDGRSLDLPTVNGDRYVFRDYTHLTAYYQELSSIFDADDHHFDVIVAENERISSVHTKLLNDEFVNPRDRYQPFLTDPIMMSILNEHFEMEVDDALLTYINNSDLLRSDPTNNTVRDIIRDIPKGKKLDILSIPKGAYWGKDTNSESFAKAWCGCNITIERFACDSIRVFGECDNFWGNDDEGNVKIFINGPGGIPVGITLIEEEIKGNFEFKFLITQNQIDNFGGPFGKLFIHAEADPDCFFNNLASEFLIFDINDGVCDFEERDTGWLWGSNGGTHGLSHRTSNYKNTWGSHEKGEMFSKWWNGSSWIKIRKNLSLTIDAKRKGSGCNFIANESDDDSCTNCYHLREKQHTTKTVAYCDGDVEGNYHKVWTVNNVNHSIDATGVIDFECCE